MREIRTLEQEPHDAPACWLIDRPHTLTVCRGAVWLTIEGESEDWWLRAGEIQMSLLCLIGAALALALQPREMAL